MMFIACDFVIFRVARSESRTEFGSHRSVRAERRARLFPTHTLGKQAAGVDLLLSSHHLPYSSLTHLGKFEYRAVHSYGPRKMFSTNSNYLRLRGSSPVKSAHLKLQQKLAHRVAAVLTRFITS